MSFNKPNFSSHGIAAYLRIRCHSHSFIILRSEQDLPYCSRLLRSIRNCARRTRNLYRRIGQPLMKRDIILAIDRVRWDGRIPSKFSDDHGTRGPLLRPCTSHWSASYTLSRYPVSSGKGIGAKALAYWYFTIHILASLLEGWVHIHFAESDERCSPAFAPKSST